MRRAIIPTFYKAQRVAKITLNLRSDIYVLTKLLASPVGKERFYRKYGLKLEKLHLFMPFNILIPLNISQDYVCAENLKYSKCFIGRLKCILSSLGAYPAATKN